MTVAHGVFTVMLPVAAITFLIAGVHKKGVGHLVRAVAISLWALSYAWPAAMVELRRVFIMHWRRSMEEV